jgi:hypothetical protein
MACALVLGRVQQEGVLAHRRPAAQFSSTSTSKCLDRLRGGQRDDIALSGRR